MDEGIEGQANALRDVLIQLGLNFLRATEADMRRMYRGHVWRMWVVRSFVLWNIGCAMSQLARADASPWLLLFTPFSLACAWYSFRVSERFASDLPMMRRGLADVREKIKTAEGLANES